MSTILVVAELIQNYSISLGVGASTLAIINFFAAIADGTIDVTERRMMGLVYIVLRIAMALILLTTLIIVIPQFIVSGFHSFSALALGQLLALCMLFLNAILMTMKIMPSTFGPAIQAGSWYALGVLTTLSVHGIDGFNFSQFILAYVTWIIFAVSFVNGMMAIMKAQRHGFLTK